MKLKYHLTILTLLLGLICNSQNDLVEIKGMVSSSDPKGIIHLIKNAEIILYKSDSTSLSVLSNDSGQYSFKIKPFNGSGTITIQTSKKTMSVDGRNLGYLASKDIAKIDLSRNKVYIKNFELTEAIICYSFPSIHFKNNSVEVYWKKSEDPNEVRNESPAEVINMLYQAMSDDPTIIIQLSGHCNYNEISKDSLSLARANYVAEQLIKKGIPTGRLVPKGYADTKLLIKCEIIKKAKKDEEKEALRQKNRRVTFSILSWDYKPN